MIRDYLIPKPLSLAPYEVHRFVAQLCDGVPYLFVSKGDHVLVRTAKPLCDRFRELVMPKNGDVIAFSLRSAVSKRVNGKDVYARPGDWRARHEWLAKRSEQHGFMIRALHVTSDSVRIAGRNSKIFHMDQSDFTGVLTVTDGARIAECLTRGIGRVGKAYGMGMLVI
jgi:hypothetical protein